MGLLFVLIPAAVFAQAQSPDDEKIRGTIERLGADFLEERDTARAVLEKLGKSVEPSLIQALSHPDYRVRRTCLELLLPLKSSRALKRATEIFTSDEDPTVRDAAFRLLQSLGMEAEDSIITALASPNAEYRLGAIRSLQDLKSQKCAEKIAELYDRETDKKVKGQAWKCLMSLGSSAEPYLLKYLQDPDREVRRDALLGLRDSTDDRTIAGIGKAFEAETEQGPLDQAYEDLVHAGLRAEPSFLAGLKSSRPNTAVRSIQGLGLVKSERALEPIAQLFLGECPAEVRTASVSFLKAQGLRAEIPLIRGLEVQDPLIRNLSIQTLGEIGSERALETVGRLFAEVKDRDLHLRCFEYLRRFGMRAESALLRALADEEKEIRRQAIEALGDARSEKAIPSLIEFATQLDSSMKDASEAALASIGPKAIEAVEKAVAEGRIKKSVADSISERYTRVEVERLLEAQLSEDLYTGFYEDQFSDLRAFGRDQAMPVLVRILKEPRYPFRRIDRTDKAERYRESMRTLAVMAVGELGGEGALAAVRSFAQDEMQSKVDQIHEETLVALYRLGDKSPLENHLRELRTSADQALAAASVRMKQEGCALLFPLARLYHRLKRYDDAIGAYQERLRVMEEQKADATKDEWYNTTCYNLACEYSLKGVPAKALEWLDRAVKAGYSDRPWMLKDKDLDPIRGEAGFKKILADPGLQEKKPDGGAPTDK